MFALNLVKAVAIAQNWNDAINEEMAIKSITKDATSTVNNYAKTTTMP